MDRTFLNARSPLRLLEKGLHGGLGKGNLGLILAGHGVGKTPFLVGVALDDLLRGDHVLHVVLGETVAHTRAHYDTVFADLASTTHLEAEAQTHADIDRLRTIRAYAPEGFDAGKLREAIKVEQEANGTPGLVILEGYDLATASHDDVAGLKALAEEIQAEVWLSHGCDAESVSELPSDVEPVRDQFGVILALEPQTDSVALKALKEHDNPDAQTLRVALDPKTLLLTRH